MNEGDLIRNLLEAQGVPQSSIKDDNLFKNIGFDNAKARLGWVNPPLWEDIEKSLEIFLEKTKDKKDFIFIGMGGSANGIKTLINLSSVKNIHALDSLDTKAIENVLEKIESVDTTLVIPISKSGTTKETQLIANTIKSYFKDKFKHNFLWASDKEGSFKLDELGWSEVEKITIQINRKSDIGGRFSAPHTMIFLMPLALILNKDLDKLKNIWQSYVSNQNSLRIKAKNEALKYTGKNEIRLLVEVKKDILEGFSNWVIQLIEESLGSKKKEFFIKTLVGKYNAHIKHFTNLKLEENSKDPYVYVMSYMYFLEVFTSFLAYINEINFVTQDYVEVYKKELKALEGAKIEEPQKKDLENIKSVLDRKIKDAHEFIDCVLFFDGDQDYMNSFKAKLEKIFPKRIISIFIGSDWNHHSYQAAFGDEKTFFLIVPKENYKTPEKISSENAVENTTTLKKIAYATYKTIKDKAMYVTFG